MANTAEQIAQAENERELEGIKWWSMRSKRSEALPKHSLFGSSLENVDKEELQNIKGKYIPVGYIRPHAERYPLPEHLKERIPGMQMTEFSKTDFSYFLMSES